MSDEAQALGANHAADLRDRAEAYAEALDELDEAKARVKELKDDAKSEGYDMKVFGQIVKEKRKGAEYQATQLSLELTLTTYRGAVGLPTDLAEAQKRALQEAASEPEAKSERKSKQRRGRAH